jgi:hypothetical protein
VRWIPFLFVVGCGSDRLTPPARATMIAADPPPAPLGEVLARPADPAALTSASVGAAGTVLVVERHHRACWSAIRVLLHVEATLRPGDGGFALDDVTWFEARVPRAGTDPSCEVATVYLGELAVLRPGTRVAVFGDWERSDLEPTLDLPRSASVTMRYAAPFDDLPALATRMGPIQTTRNWLAPARPAFLQRGEVVFDQATRLVWQRGMSPRPVFEGVAHEYCDQLVLGGRDDWRVPSVAEVATLLPRDGVGVVAALPSPRDAMFWTWHDGRDGEPWVVAFATGELVDTHYDEPDPYGPYRVRCVADHVAAARRILAEPGWYDTATERVDLVAELAWEKQPRGAATQADARSSCAAPWRLPTMAELRGRVLRGVAGDDAPDVPLWAGDVARLHDSHRLFERDQPIADEPPFVLCVQSRPHRRPTGTRAYPSGDAFADGEKRYWELGGVAWDGARSFFPDGRPASKVTLRDGLRDGPATFYSRTGARVATVTFRGGVLDGAIEIAGVIRLTARHGELEGLAALGTLRGRYVHGVRDGAWVAVSGREVATATYRNGILHGPARRTGAGVWVGGYRDGLRDGAWSYDHGAVRGEAVFVAGTGVWRTREAARPTLERAFLRDVPHGETNLWWANGDRQRTRYDRGREVEQERVLDGRRTVTTHTRETVFFANGAKASERALPHGAYARWDEAGAVVEQGTTTARGREGTWRLRVAPDQVLVTVWREGRRVDAARLER